MGSIGGLGRGRLRGLGGRLLGWGGRVGFGMRLWRRGEDRCCCCPL